MLLALLVSGTGYAWARQWVQLLGGEGAVLDYGTAYYELLVLGSFFTLLGLSSSTLIRATGQIRQATVSGPWP